MKMLTCLLLTIAPYLASAQVTDGNSQLPRHEGPSVIGDIARDASGKALSLNFSQAQRYCVDHGSRLPTAAEYVDLAMSLGARGGDYYGKRISLTESLSQNHYISSYYDPSLTDHWWPLDSPLENQQAVDKATAAVSKGDIFFGLDLRGFPYIFPYSSAGYAAPVGDAGSGYYWFSDSYMSRFSRAFAQVFSASNGNFIRAQTAYEAVTADQADTSGKFRVRCVVAARPAPSGSIEARATLQALEKHFQSTDLAKTIGFVGLRQPANPLYRVANWKQAKFADKQERHVFHLTFLAGQNTKARRDCYAAIDSSNPCVVTVTVFACESRRPWPSAPGPEESWHETVNFCQ